MTAAAIVHTPVLQAALGELLNYPADGTVVDCTVGQGGHALELARRLGAGGRLIGLDVDPGALETSRRRLGEAVCRVDLVRENFGRLEEVLDGLGIEKTDVILADVGVSSAQLADPKYGISFQGEGPLDMRLDDRLERTAADLVNGLRQDELADVIYRYGEERKSRRIARAIVERRRKKKFESTSELVDVINRSLGIRGEGRKSRIHPATRTFQALRIAVNDELGQLARLMEAGPRRLKAGGQMAVISFHSLEDRLVKNSFRDGKKTGVYEILTAKPVVAGQDERRSNPRARSAKLRVAKKL